MNMRIGKYLFVALLLLLTSMHACKKDEDSPSSPETGIVADIENNIYKTVKIGNRWWMAENLRVKTFRDGTPIAYLPASDNWTNGIAAYCVFENNPESPGLLYNWHAVNHAAGIAPEGWHVPTDEDWQELERELGMEAGEAAKKGWRGTHEGEKLKTVGTTDWSDYPNIWPTNESGFSALAGGCRLVDGTWGNPGLHATGFWWSSSERTNEDAWYRYLDYKNSKIFRSQCQKAYGFNIRCVKD